MISKDIFVQEKLNYFSTCMTLLLVELTDRLTASEHATYCPKSIGVNLSTHSSLSFFSFFKFLKQSAAV